MAINDLVNVEHCTHPVIRKDGEYKDLGLMSYTCAQPKDYKHGDEWCGGSFTDYVNGGLEGVDKIKPVIPFERYKLLGVFEGKEYHRLEPKENMSPIRMPL